MLDIQLCVQGASDSFYSAFQTTPGQTLGNQLASLGDGEWADPALIMLLKELPETDGEFGDFAVEHDFPRLGRRAMLVSGQRLPPLDGARTGMILLSIEDVTTEKCIEGEDTVESPTQFNPILISIADAVIVTDLESCVTFINPAAEKFTGWIKSHALRRRVSEICKIVNEQSREMESPVEKAIQTGEAVGLDRAILISRDGGEWPIDASAAPILDAVRSITGIVLVFHDISNRRKIEGELEFSEVRYRRLFESAHDGILILDAGTAKVEDVNPYMGELLGYPREHFIGKELWEIGVFKDVESSKVAMAALQKAGHIRYEDHPLQHSDGRHIPVEFVSNVYREGRQTVIQCNIRDITERKHMAEQLMHAREDAEASNRSKSEFLANMSHEIRTPMSAIVGFADMLLQKTPEECTEIGCVQIIRRNSLHLLELVNDILDLSKVEAGQMQVEHAVFDLPALLSDIISLMRPRASEKGLAFEVTFDGLIPQLIQSDAFRLRQILINLLGNSVKFTESGKITVRVSADDSGGPNILLRIDVTDSGIGMSPEMVARLFRPFTQGDASITRKFGGTGLGLTISKQLAKLLGGDVTVTSRLGTGSTFTLTVDGGPSAGVEQLRGLTEGTLPKKLDQNARPEIYLRGRILLVEDGADNQRLLRMQLSSAGASVVSAANGKIAVELVAAQPFDLILMDMQMPVMDGYAATAELRRQGVKTPIIALTAYAMAEDREKCLATGCDAYLSKPVDEDTLLATVDHYLGKRVPIDNPDDVAKSRLAADAAYGSELIRSSLAGDPRMMEIIPGYVGRLPAKVSQMRDLLELHDLSALQKILHDLLGSAGGYGFAAISPPAGRAQRLIREGAALEPVAAEINSLIEVIRRIEGYDESSASGASEESAK